MLEKRKSVLVIVWKRAHGLRSTEKAFEFSVNNMSLSVRKKIREFIFGADHESEDSFNF